MKTIITPCEHFMKEMYEKSKNIFTNENTENTICEVKTDSDILLLLPRTANLDNLKNYKNLKYLEINNYKIGRKENAIFDKNIDNFKNITHLKIWNIKQDDMEVIKYFPKLTHLLVSYIGKEDFLFEGIKYANKIHTLCLVSVNKIKNLDFLEKDVKEKIKNLNITYCSRLNNLHGINEYKNLETLTINYSTTESRKRILLENINGIEQLNKLKYLELNYYNISMDYLQIKLTYLKKLKYFIMDNVKYKNI